MMAVNEGGARRDRGGAVAGVLPLCKPNLALTSKNTYRHAVCSLDDTTASALRDRWMRTRS